MDAPRDFQTTKWSLVLAAREGTTDASRSALESLCSAYWYPLYAYVRSQGYGAERARDLTQGYFLRLLERDYLRDVRPGMGRFRSFLLVSLKHYISNERDHERAQKRGGGRPPLPLETDGAEERYRGEPAETMDAEKMYERRWAFTVLDRVRGQLREEFEREGKRDRFVGLEGFLAGGQAKRSYREAAAELGMSEAAVKMALHRMRRRFGKLLRREIGQTVAASEEIDDEIRYLFALVSG